MESYDYDSIPLLALVAALVIALIAHPACTFRLTMTSAPVSILAAALVARAPGLGVLPFWLLKTSMGFLVLVHFIAVLCCAASLTFSSTMVLN
jgi:hypothetical protein